MVRRGALAAVVAAIAAVLAATSVPGALAVPALAGTAPRPNPAARPASAPEPAAAPDPARWHLVRLRNAHQVSQVLRAFGRRALWAWDAADDAYRPITEVAPAAHATLYTTTAVAAELHLVKRPAVGTKKRAVATKKPTASQGSGARAALPVSGAAGPWHLVFDDEFAGSSLDTSRWTPYWFSEGSTSNETAMYSANVAVSDGTLALTLTPSSGALVSTNGKFQFSYGYVEARIDLPASGSAIANWPAFWTDGQDWPTDGELDVMEGLGGQACFHFHSDAGGPGSCAPGSYTGWHTYGADWEPGSVSYYYDGHKVGTITEGITGAPMYLILENSGGSYGGPSVRPATMRVDYVRVWQH